MALNDPDQPSVGLPAEAVFAALLEEQSPVPYESEKREEPAATPAPAPAAPTVTVPANATQLKGPALRLAQNMEASLGIPTATSFRDLPVGELESRRAALNQGLKAAGRSDKLSFTHLIAWALVQAGREFPGMGTSVLQSGSDTFKVVPEHLNLGLAVDVERKDGTRGLVVPVVKRADTLSFAEFHRAYEGLVEKARTNKLMPDDFAGATMTLTNPGGLGTVASVPRLMPGQGTIIATGAIAWRPEFARMEPATLRQLGIGKTMTMTSTYDHRVIQGAESGSFLRLVDQLLQGEHGFYQGIAASLGLAIAPAAEAPAPVAAGTAPAPQGTGGGVAPESVAAGMGLVEAYRTHGLLAAKLDPLGAPPPGDPALDPATWGLTPDILGQLPSSVFHLALPGRTLREALPQLRDTYCGAIAYEVEHLAEHERRAWLRQQIESGAHRTPLTREEKRRLFERISTVEGLERFLHRAYLGAKRFSIEGVDVMVPMLDEAVELAAEVGARDVVIGMAHRGRLNVLTHSVGRPYDSILAEFEGGAAEHVAGGGTGDVKYHLGAEGSMLTRAGRAITVALLPNPSHLEFVDPVVVGHARARQTSRNEPTLRLDPNAALPITIHGDAAFPGQGVVAETLNLSNLPGYRTGGTLHIIANNQVGFTTDPVDGRSTRFSSDLAKGFDIPIIHVNADEPEACIAAVRLAMAYRTRFQDDVLIDLVGYRRHGHNEGDEPSYTQPTMYAIIKDLPTVREKYAAVLESEGILASGEAASIAEQIYHRFVEIQTAYKAARAAAAAEPGVEAVEGERAVVATAVSRERLEALNEQLLKWPATFTPHPKLVRQLERRRTGLTAEKGIDWAHAEALAFASLLTDGVPIRLTGQDVGRGTFSHRHMVLHDSKTGEIWTPAQVLPGATATLEVRNSPLSELATIGFEYGYATASQESLVVWEAQYGDFVNGAQVMLDQFVSSGLTKWGVTSRLTLLLPHGYEGGGPEHSSARLERFLQLTAERNIRVANCSTPAQYFHLLRRQALDPEARPLVVMTPKSLLRLPAAGSSLHDLTDARFHAVVDDPSEDARRAATRSLVLCTGKVYYDLIEEAKKRGGEHPPIARLEQLYPLPEADLRALIAGYPSLTEVVWAQEEPRNMGAWSWLEPRLSAILPPGVYLRYIGRPERASPAEGYASSHTEEQHRIVDEALAAGTSLVKSGK